MRLPSSGAELKAHHRAEEGPIRERSDEELLPENLDTIARIAAYVARKKGM